MPDDEGIHRRDRAGFLQAPKPICLQGYDDTGALFLHTSAVQAALPVPALDRPPAAVSAVLPVVYIILYYVHFPVPAQKASPSVHRLLQSQPDIPAASAG